MTEERSLSDWIYSYLHEGTGLNTKAVSISRIKKAVARLKEELMETELKGYIPDKVKIEIIDKIFGELAK